MQHSQGSFVRTGEEIAARNARRCVHFNGFANRRCKAGVQYKALLSTVDPDALEIVVTPCIGKHSASSGYQCDARTVRSVDDCRIDYAAVEARVGRLRDAQTAVRRAEQDLAAGREVDRRWLMEAKVRLRRYEVENGGA